MEGAMATATATWVMEGAMATAMAWQQRNCDGGNGWCGGNAMEMEGTMLTAGSSSKIT
jgi:hypothetical protein